MAWLRAPFPPLRGRVKRSKLRESTPATKLVHLTTLLASKARGHLLRTANTLRASHHDALRTYGVLGNQRPHAASPSRRRKPMAGGPGARRVDRSEQLPALHSGWGADHAAAALSAPARGVSGNCLVASPAAAAWPRGTGLRAASTPARWLRRLGLLASTSTASRLHCSVLQAPSPVTGGLDAAGLIAVATVTMTASAHSFDTTGVTGDDCVLGLRCLELGRPRATSADSALASRVDGTRLVAGSTIAGRPVGLKLVAIPTLTTWLRGVGLLAITTIALRLEGALLLTLAPGTSRLDAVVLLATTTIASPVLAMMRKRLGRGCCGQL